MRSMRSAGTRGRPGPPPEAGQTASASGTHSAQGTMASMRSRNSSRLVRCLLEAYSMSAKLVCTCMEDLLEMPPDLRSLYHVGDIPAGRGGIGGNRPRRLSEINQRFPRKGLRGA